MIITKKNDTWTAVASGSNTWVGTKEAFEAIKDELPNNTVAYITDDGWDLEGEISNLDTRISNNTSNIQEAEDRISLVEVATTPTSGSASWTVSPLNGYFKWQKIGKLVILNVYAHCTSTSWATVTLPEAIRPKQRLEGMQAALIWGDQMQGSFYLNTDLTTITIGLYKTAGAEGSGQISYLVN